MATGYDVLIIGGGAAGCVLARRLGDAGRAVCVLEAGPDPREGVSAALRDGWNLPTGEDWPYDWGFEAEPGIHGTPRKVRRGRVLGGTSWLTRFAVRGARTDFESWDDGSGVWAWEAVLAAFRRIETDRDFGDESWHGKDGPLPIDRYRAMSRSPIHEAVLEALGDLGIPAVDDHNAPDAVGNGPMPMSTARGGRVTTLDAWLPVDATPRSVTIRTDALVDRVVFDGDRATGVRLANRGVLTAAEVVLAAGTYGSPPLLMRSGVGPAGHLAEHRIPVIVDLPGVGENLADHPGVDLDSGWRGDASDGPALHTLSTFRSASQPEDASPDLLFWLTDPEGSDTTFALDPILLKPLSRGRVRLRSANAAAAPLIELPDLTAERDFERLGEAYRFGLEAANHRAVRALASGAVAAAPASPVELRARITDGAFTIPHVVGTCRMGVSPEDGAVVDAHGRVHGVRGLSVIDASIIPDAPAGFPHLVTIMVAERLASLWNDAAASRPG